MARAFLEGLRWPDGKICPHCSSVEKISLLRGGSTREGVYKCYGCSRPFTVTVGTAFEGTKVSLDKWLLAFGLFATSSDRVTIGELCRTLGISYPAARWMHRTIGEIFSQVPSETGQPAPH